MGNAPCGHRVLGDGLKGVLPNSLLINETPSGGGGSDSGTRRPFRQTYKSNGGPIITCGRGGSVITVQKLALAIQKRFGGTEAEALAESRTVMSYFGFRSVIIDNAIHPDDRKVFYALHDAGLLQSFWETVPLLDGRNWRIFYWSLNEADLDRILVDEQAPPEEPVYKSLPDEAWGRPAAGG